MENQRRRSAAAKVRACISVIDANIRLTSVNAGARKGDYVALDLLASLTEVGGGKDVELVLLVPESTFPICMASSLQTSLDGVDWMTRHGTWRCVQSAVHSGNHGPSGEDKPMQECSVRSLDADAEHARWFRILLNDDVDVKWVLHEIWMREPKQP